MTLIELLIPDLQGDPAAISVVRESGADVVGHNLETTARLTPLCRDARASYERSLSVLEMLAASANGPAVKSALLLGLGETRAEIIETLQEAYRVGTRHIAMGQYLAPSSSHTPVVRYWTPEDFQELGEEASAIGYLSVASGPLVRSSYRADQFAGNALTGK
jgi:lipoic acid synthetase